MTEYFLLTIDALEKDVENAVSRYCKFTFVQKAVLNALLVMLTWFKVVVLQIIKKSACDGANTLYIINSRRELLLAVLYRILQIL